MGKQRSCSRRSKSSLKFPKYTIPSCEFVTKKAFLRQEQSPSCPFAPPKLKKSLRLSWGEPKIVFGEAKPVTFNGQGALSRLYRPDVRMHYINQVYSHKMKIGEGSFGSVYKALCNDDNKYYAIKQFKEEHSHNGKFTEIQNMEKIGVHQNIIRFHMAWEENDTIYIKMECGQMSLAQYSKLNHSISETQIHTILYDISNALMFLHNKGYVHLDVKPDNILIQEGYYKLCDFGLLYSKSENNNSERLTSEGDSRYLAPEVLQGVYSDKADIFALGMSILELATDYILPQNGRVWHLLRSFEAPEDLPKMLKTDLIALIYHMLQRDYKKRPSANCVLQNPMVNMVLSQDLVIPRQDFLHNMEMLPYSTVPTFVLHENNNLENKIISSTPRRSRSDFIFPTVTGEKNNNESSESERNSFRISRCKLFT